MQSDIDKISLPEPDFLENLNSQQKEAVTNIDGPLLVLSGAGTGKTRVLTTRLANIIFNKKAKISEILSVTFTNKAAFEMKQRVEKILKFPIEGMFIGTFHSIGVRILRKHAELLGLKSDFTILDKEDQLRLIKQVLSSMNLDTKNYVPKNFLYMIDQMKNLGFSPDEISNHEFEIKSNGKLSEIYSFYQERLKNFNSVDFGDLILLPLNLMRKNKEILEFYSNKFKYILVDEYQDTNSTQYMLLRLLAGVKKNICCVGDEDQSIYGWRGAQLKNILNFEKDFENAKIVRLEQNYRSTANILGAATSLISENKERIGKKLWTVDQLGKPVEIINIDNDELEASFICNKISEFQNKGIKLSNIAILTRASFQFKDLEDRFIKESIKYRVVGGLRFYERREIKDAIAYFRLLVNKSDNLSLERIVNVPKRSIGPSTIKKLYEISKNNNTSLFESIKFGVLEKVFTNKIEKNLIQFLSIIEKYTMMLETTDHSDVAGSLLDDSGYTEMLQKEKSPESEGRLENLKKLVIDIRNRDSLGDFLEEVSLLTDIMDNNLNLEKVSLMTLHSAKGLEFDYVFLPGWEEGIFPNQRNIDEYGTKGLEEERRLGYVGITRARKNLIISYVNFRKQYNYSFYRSLPSRFISELPKKNCKIVVSEEKKAEKNKLLNYSNINFSVGDKVLHSEFGEGQILGINDNKLQIRFNNSSEIIKIFSDFVKKI
ncbi:MAG: DNA helicase II [Rickettsiales bacterium]|nr:DNA helicase II [Rickettsiales bacterium]